MVCASPPSLKRQVSSDSHGSYASQSSRKLLFGEIPSPIETPNTSLRSNNSLCNLVMSTSSAFLRFWLSDSCRDAFLAQVDKADLPAVRLVCHDLSTRAEPFLFEDMTITFRPSTFTRPARMEALERIGHHVHTLTFNLPHTSETFLPPLVDHTTGEERSFVYEPQIHKPSTLIGRVKQPKYGSWEMTDLLIQQYPPLFHAATNIPAFIRALTALSSISHLRLDCSGQDPTQRHRRSTVDYALISLRIAVERSPLYDLDTLTFSSMHPAGLLHLQPIMGLGGTPASLKRWAQIRTLAIHMDSFSFSDSSYNEHLRMLHSYLRTFTPFLRSLFFRWRDEKGPSPLTLDLEPCLQPDTTDDSDIRKTIGLHGLRFLKLRYMEIENSITDSSQISAFVSKHRHKLREFNFEDITLRSGDWDDALAPLTRMAEEWKNRTEEVMDVPLILSPVGLDHESISDSVEDQSITLGQMSLSKWLAKKKTSKAASKAKEQLWGYEEHMRKFLRTSVFPWR
ncbi:uncharacterized protein K452DRAFT_253560 [Aplosporella prunicola CBS 121167]|uniref:Uncharacterized protein n=1 Tax=Aplosporella prunicola CBS 121167 TaxID=1176127 RepID=A0A6A6B706_9PEZI|nr:uncharacterized protein K452DRAFT_253560 [Aplosporella prunicola CBS 121167]KAF2139922.1 hypothetical protein K452DRAFT_253560 [Aplosporella prunicola CBS 121167]